MTNADTMKKSSFSQRRRVASQRYNIERQEESSSPQMVPTTTSTTSPNHYPWPTPSPPTAATTEQPDYTDASVDPATSWEALSSNQSASIRSKGGSSVETRVPKENRFMPQHDSRKQRQSPELVITTSALQFVPAYEEAISTRARLSETSTPKSFRNGSRGTEKEREATSQWDAIVEADGPKIKRRNSWRTLRGGATSRDNSLDRGSCLRDSSLERADRTSPPFRSNSLERGRASPFRRRDKTSPNPITSSKPSSNTYHGESDTSSLISGSQVSTSRPRGPRIARIAQLFSSRATVKTDGEDPIVPTQQRTSMAPSQRKSSTAVKTRRSRDTLSALSQSPSHSSLSGSSTGFANWPGTQDKRGVTVKMDSSYDDSSVGAAAFHKRTYEMEANDDELDMRKWMDGEASLGDESSMDTREQPLPEKEPQRRPLTDRNQPDELDDDDQEELKSSADYHLAAVLSEARRTPTDSRSRPVGGSSYPTSGDSHGKPNYYRSRGLTGAGSVSGMRNGSSSVAATEASGGISISNMFENQPVMSGTSGRSALQSKHKRGPSDRDPWDSSSQKTPSSPGSSSVSKGSSAYFSTQFKTDPMARYGVRRNTEGAASVMRRKPSPQAPTVENLKRAEYQNPPRRTFNAHNVPGYRGFLDKTKDVPNLMDALEDDSLAETASMLTANPMQSGRNHRFRERNRPFGRLNTLRQEQNGDIDDESDVFAGISNAGLEPIGTSGYKNGKYATQESRGLYDGRDTQTTAKENVLNLVPIGGGLSVIQTTQDDYDNRKTPSEFDDNLTNSEVDQYGFVHTPGFHSMLEAGKREHDTTAKFVEPTREDLSPNAMERRMMEVPSMFDSPFPQNDTSESGSSQFSDELRLARVVSFAGDLRKYCVHPRMVKKLVRVYRNMCRSASTDIPIGLLEKQEDYKKAFALTEMRSRVMEKDLERGLERQGGTVPVDDLVLTEYNKGANRIRDAVIVSKAWRDGASPKDVITAFRLTRRDDTAYFIKRPIQLRRYDHLVGANDSSTVSSEYSYAGSRAYFLEEVRWIDDTDFAMLRCPSLGPRSMRGSEIFTIGDCQSILLKLTNSRCSELRKELNEATARQIEAEELMKHEGDLGDDIMTDAEMDYLQSMEDVKTISKQLVIAEKSFHLVRDRIEKLVAKYEALLVKIENESIATESVITFESSYYSDEYESDYSLDDDDDREKAMFQRRVQRAELKAEVAAREALLARQEARKIKAEKQREIELLQQKLADLQSESSHAIAEREHSIVLAKAITAKTTADAMSSHSNPAGSRINQGTINGVKQKFRDRMAQRMQNKKSFGSEATCSTSDGLSYSSSVDREVATARKAERPPLMRNHRHRLVGEEMFQHLDFYERSLKAVDKAD